MKLSAEKSHNMKSDCKKLYTGIRSIQNARDMIDTWI